METNIICECGHLLHEHQDVGCMHETSDGICACPTTAAEMIDVAYRSALNAIIKEYVQTANATTMYEMACETLRTIDNAMQVKA